MIVHRGLCGVMFAIVKSDPLEVIYSVTDDFGELQNIDPQVAIKFVEADQGS